MLHSLERHLHLFVLLFLSVIHVCFGWNYVSMLDIGRAVENAQWLLLLQKQQCLVLERTGFGIFCRNDMSKMQTFWRSQHPPPYIYRCVYIYIHTTLHTTLHCIALHYITLHCIALHYITLHYIHIYIYNYIHIYIYITIYTHIYM